jgi:SAM-dependent methyltransferase
VSDFDRGSWEERWSNALREHGDRLAQRPPNAWLTAELAGLEPGRALDAGCGHGAESLWLAARGWRVTAVDFSATALDHARSSPGAEQVEWIEADLSTWAPEPEAYDLVVCLYVHAAGSVEELVQRMARGVAPAGTLFLVGYPEAPGQRQVAVDDVRAALNPASWQLVVAEERPRPAGGTDAVISASRLPRRPAPPPARPPGRRRSG